MIGLTLKEAVEAARGELYKINVPAAQIMAIGYPLGRAIDMLSACLEAMDTADKDEKGVDA